MLRIPKILVFLRASLGPILLFGGWSNWSGVTLCLVLLTATLTDVFDGVLARRFGVATQWLRRADSLADMIFYGFVAVLMIIRYPEVLQQYGMGIAAVVLLELFRILLDHYKFGKQAAYHMWSAKAWGVVLFFGFSALFLTGQGGVLFTMVVVLGIFTELEGVAASLVLPEWRHDVPSIIHAYQIRRFLVSERMHGGDQGV